jgi:flagellar biosynthesis/type III secretory pathway protein FliH
MNAVQTMPWLTVPQTTAAEISSTESPTPGEQLQVLLTNLPAAERSMLLRPWLEEALQQRQEELAQAAATEQQQWLRQQQELMRQSAQQQQQQWLSSVQQQWQHLLDGLAQPETVLTAPETEQILLLALELAQKILSHQALQPELYQQWAAELLHTSFLQQPVRLDVSHADYQLLQQWQLLPALEARFGSVTATDCGRFSFVFHTAKGSHGHQSLQVLQQLQQWLSHAEC